MHVGGAVFHRLDQDKLKQLDHRAALALGGVFVFRQFLGPQGRQVVDQFVQGFGFLSIVAFQDRFDLVVGGQGGGNVHAQVVAQGVDGGKVFQVRHGDAHGSVFLAFIRYGAVKFRAGGRDKV